MNGSILVTGGAGYIGSHACLCLLLSGYKIIVVDNFSNSVVESIKRVEKLTGCSIKLLEGDICDYVFLSEVFKIHDIEAVLHFAGLKSVNQSLLEPLSYYDVNVGGSLTLLRVMEEYGVYKIVFSSSATVYGEQARSPCKETDLRGSSTNPYGSTKAVVEQVLEALAKSNKNWSISCLRYFNPIGAHESGLIGENGSGIPTNLMPYICQVALGNLDILSIFGNDYNTPDGTCQRDYIHVMDLAEGHVTALKFCAKNNGIHFFNLGTGVPFSVLEIVQAFEEETSQTIAMEITARREGDLGSVYADVTKAKMELEWQANRDLKAMIADAWRWVSKNPSGYDN